MGAGVGWGVGSWGSVCVYVYVYLWVGVLSFISCSHGNRDHTTERSPVADSSGQAVPCVCLVCVLLVPLCARVVEAMPSWRASGLHAVWSARCTRWVTSSRRASP